VQIDVVKAVHKKAYEALGHWFSTIVAPGQLGTEVEREMGKAGLSWMDEDEVLEIQGMQLDAAEAFWKNIGVKSFEDSHFCYGIVNKEGEAGK
jgi:hypothetical protein